MPKFSICICTHNRAKLAEEAILSIFQHCDLSEAEILVIDNASTDDTADRLRSYHEAGQINMIYLGELGLSLARNVGLKNSKGDYIVFLDDDGSVSATWLQGFADVIKQNENVGAVGGKIIPTYETTPPSWLSAEGRRFYGEYDLGDQIQETDWVPGGNVAWHLGTIRKLGGFNVKFGRVGKSPVLGSEESILCQQVMEQGMRLYYTPAALMYHKIGAAKLTLVWLLKRHYGQGVTSVRWQNSIGNLVDNAKLRRHILATLKRVAQNTASMLGFFLTGRKNEAMNALMRASRFWGEAREANNLRSSNR